MKIEPTVGRVVLYTPPKSHYAHAAAPLAATVAHVHADGRINLGYLDDRGYPLTAQNVRLIQEGEERPAAMFAEWMPYQIGQAALLAEWIAHKAARAEWIANKEREDDENNKD
jgi:hypothetical protein